MNVLTSAISSIVGLGIGFGLGLMVRSTSEVDERPGVKTKDVLSTLMGVVILILVTSTVVMQMQSSARSRQTTECLSNAIAIRSQASHEGSVAQRTLLITLGTSGITAGQKQQALDNYINVLDKIDRVQQDNPIGPGACDPG
jgi:hypothetical protein